MWAFSAMPADPPDPGPPFALPLPASFLQQRKLKYINRHGNNNRYVISDLLSNAIIKGLR